MSFVKSVSGPTSSGSPGGFSGHGFLQGPAVGEVLRDLYLGRDPVVDVGTLAAERFSLGEVVLERGIV